MHYYFVHFYSHLCIKHNGVCLNITEWHTCKTIATSSVYRFTSTSGKALSFSEMANGWKVYKVVPFLFLNNETSSSSLAAEGEKSVVSSVAPWLTSILITLLHMVLKAHSVQFNDQTRESCRKPRLCQVRKSRCKQISSARVTLWSHLLHHHQHHTGEKNQHFLFLVGR